MEDTANAKKNPEVKPLILARLSFFGICRLAFGIFPRH
jgi:hypothetical protein